MLSLALSLSLAAVTCELPGSVSGFAQPEPAPLLSDPPLVQLMLSFNVSSVSDSEDLDDARLMLDDAHPARVLGNEPVRYAVGEDLTLEMGEGRALRTVATPRMLVLAGQDAQLVIGEGVEYLQLEPDGETMRRVSDDELYEGLRIDTIATLAGEEGIRFDRLDIALSRVVGHVGVRDESGALGIDLAMGRPIVVTTTYSLPITLEAGQRAVVIVEPGADDDEAFVVTVEASVVEPD